MKITTSLIAILLAFMLSLLSGSISVDRFHYRERLVFMMSEARRGLAFRTISRAVIMRALKAWGNRHAYA